MTLHDEGLAEAIKTIRDRQEVEDAMARYSRGLDERAWEEWDGLFTDDARLDYRAIGLGRITPDDFRAHVTGNDPVRVAGQHLHSNVLVEIDGATAIVRAEYTMVNIVRSDEDGAGMMTRAGGGCVYEFKHVGGRWRIHNRIARTKWSTRETLSLR